MGQIGLPPILEGKEWIRNAGLAFRPARHRHFHQATGVVAAVRPARRHPPAWDAWSQIFIDWSDDVIAKAPAVLVWQ